MEGPQQRRFRIHHGLGRGGYGEVYKATMTSPGGLRAEVAVKLLRIDQHADEDAVRRLRDEGKLLAALQHPTILRVYDLAVLDGRIGLVTEFVDGQDLRGCMDDDDPLPIRPLLEVVGLVAEGLHAAYEAPAPDTGEPMLLIHRDVKPSNLRISRHGRLKILDFGIARSEAVDREARTGSQATLGSLAYMSPERFDARPAGPAADVFSLGCVLYEGLAHRRFYPEAVPVHMYRMAASLKAYDLHCEKAFAALEGQPEEVVALIRDMLIHEPDDRVVARDVASRCEALVDRIDGPSLKRWARERTWPDPQLVTTSFDGRTLTDGTLHTGAFAPSWLPSVPDASETLQFDHLPTEEMTGPPSRSGTIEPDSTHLENGPTDLDPNSPVRERHSAVPLLLIGIVVVVLLAGVAMMVGFDDETTPVPEPVPTAPAPVVPEPAPAPVPEPVVAPAPEPEPLAAPPAPEPMPAPSPAPAAPRPAPAPQPAAPLPAPQPEPEPPRPVRPSGTVEVRGGTLSKLVAPDGTVHRTDTVPGGPYAVTVKIQGRDFDLGTVRIPPNGRITFDCNPMTFDCERLE